MSERNQGIISGIEGTVTIHSDVDATTSAILLNNWTATIAPAITDDSGAGYAVGSEWIDVTANKSYKLVDASVGAAVWIETTGGGSGAFLPLAGGTMTGAIEMGTNQITNGIGVAGVTTGALYHNDGSQQIAISSTLAQITFFDGFVNGVIDMGGVTGLSKTWTMPDATGVVALVTDVQAPSLINTAVATTFVNPNETINCTSGTFAVALPSASGIIGTTYTLVNSGTGVIVLAPVVGQFINGSAAIDLVQYVSRTVQSDGADWIII
jgi:hypothetical protein